MKNNLKDLAIISKKNLKDLIEIAGHKVYLSPKDTVEATVLAEYAYEAGKLHNELSLSFDDPKGRFLNTDIDLQNQ